MDNLSNLALIAQMIESAEKNIQSAKQLLREMMGGKADFSNNFTKKAQVLSVSEGGKVIEGVFDGQNMIGPDGKQYPVPANYASKSKLVEGDVLNTNRTFLTFELEDLIRQPLASGLRHLDVLSLAGLPGTRRPEPARRSTNCRI